MLSQFQRMIARIAARKARARGEAPEATVTRIARAHMEGYGGVSREQIVELTKIVLGVEDH